MKALDFYYDGKYLSDFGYIICDFDSSSGISTSDTGCEITMETVQFRNTGRAALAGAQWGTCLSTAFCICKSADTIGEDIPVSEMRSLMTWLNRRTNCTFRLVDEELDGFFFEGTFSVARCEYQSRLVALQLTFTSNRPYALGDMVKQTLTFSSSGSEATINNQSDDIGLTHPTSVVITCNSAGSLDLYLEELDRHIYIDNCSKGEVITMNCELHLISSSLGSHELYDDFNFYFLDLTRTLTSTTNTITSTLPCTVTISYYPIVKVFI